MYVDIVDVEKIVNLFKEFIEFFACFFNRVRDMKGVGFILWGFVRFFWYYKGVFSFKRVGNE